MASLSKFLNSLLAGMLFSTQTLAESTVPDFKIGVIQSLTGIAAEDGRTVVDGIELAVQTLRDREKLNIARIIEDDQSQPKNTVASFHSLREQGVELIIGGTWDFLANSIIPLSGQYQVVLLTVSTPLESLNLSQSKGYTFALGPTITTEAKAFEKYLDQNAIDNIAILYANNSWGEAQRRVYREIIDQQRLNVLAEIESATYDSNDWRVFASKLKALNAQLVLLLLNKGDLEVFLKRAEEINYKPKVYASKNMHDAFKATPSKGLYDKACFPYPLEQLAQNSSFLKSYRDRYSEGPQIYADSAYDAVFLAVRAIQLARKNNLPLVEAMKRIQFSGVVGGYRYSDMLSLSSGKASLVCINNGQLQIQ
jgi:ABC-type branched-subunit amino acid transport system substrate-binding protein